MDELGKIRFAAMNMLARREHSRKELFSKLSTRFDQSEIEEVLNQLVEENLQSDQRFLESFVSSRVTKGQGPMKISYDLKNKGVSSDLIDDEIDKYASEWMSIAREELVRKYGSTEPEDYKEKQKWQRFLAGRGFSNDVCYRLFKS